MIYVHHNTPINILLWDMELKTYVVLMKSNTVRNVKEKKAKKNY